MKDKLVELIWKYPDKVGHWIVGYILTQLLFYVPYMNIYAIVPLVFIIALFNEIIDDFVNYNFSWRDILLTVIGSIISLINMCIYNHIHNIVL